MKIHVIKSKISFMESAKNASLRVEIKTVPEEKRL